MMNMISNTSMTSINGVVLMSIIGSPSLPPLEIAMPCSWLLPTAATLVGAGSSAETKKGGPEGPPFRSVGWIGDQNAA
jgi:hypothetical protein